VNLLVRALSRKRDTRAVIVDMKARYPWWSRQYRAVYALRYGEGPLAALRRRMLSCPDCHGTGIILADGPGDMSTCVRPCPVMTDQVKAHRIWSWWLA
jgi:hypothetical protein